MNAQVIELPSVAPGRLALLGTGTVGSAFVARYQALQARGLALPRFHWLANSRAVLACEGAPEQPLQQVRQAPRVAAAAAPWTQADALHAGDVVVDATASETVAAEHAHWLARGVHVVTANKLGQGAQQQRALQIAARCVETGACYGDSATVGAGLPLLSSLRALVEGGDRIHRIEGVLSGSLAWLFHRYDGQQPFSAAVREALDAGFTEPDPRVDLSGEDVRRKLLILARACGLGLGDDQVLVDSLVPAALAALPHAQALAQLDQLDEPVRQRWQRANDAGQVLRFIGSVEAGAARVGVQSLAADHPLASGAGTDNRVAIHSDRYRHQPLLIQGPGAGAEVTAAALLDDVLRITRNGMADRS
ncbi:homoserine dehydrogenase [Stenotrophomonas tumulicola]|uniref:Homoserine dehydrogenase n=1 Tax=Stenotrophomonas tumulicola TaxID=1685415 RepID=A0A7W3IIY5_9GAMM|nr:homoserine dehydrogenase [Stenotrophomonas tumulicola]MBA8683407.1 homoserine dehydrogenase [Stenotrophomonas tumulicola]